MTSEERIDRIEHVTAALAEERRKDREEYRQLWRDTQRQINDLTLKMADTNDKVAETNDTVARLTADLTRQIRASDERAKAAEQELRDRIASLVSAIGQLLQRP
jgi:septal ring factor EnvC (AmiA/AmiB activator)